MAYGNSRTSNRFYLRLSLKLQLGVNWKPILNERLHQAKLDALKEFAYGAGHELNNPLANIASRAQTLLRKRTPGAPRRLAAINTQAFRRMKCWPT